MERPVRHALSCVRNDVDSTCGHRAERLLTFTTDIGNMSLVSYGARFFNR